MQVRISGGAKSLIKISNLGQDSLLRPLLLHVSASHSGPTSLLSCSRAQPPRPLDTEGALDCSFERGGIEREVE